MEYPEGDSHDRLVQRLDILSAIENDPPPPAFAQTLPTLEESRQITAVKAMTRLDLDADDTALALQKKIDLAAAGDEDGDFEELQG